jgi:hypothetical protein
MTELLRRLLISCEIRGHWFVNASLQIHLDSVDEIQLLKEHSRLEKVVCYCSSSPEKSDKELRHPGKVNCIASRLN